MRRFVVTGAAGGIGREVVSQLLAMGERVVATDRDFEGLQAASEEASWPAARVRLLRHDVSDPGDWEAVFLAAEAAFGGLDVLINVAGYLRPATTLDATEADVHRHLDVNVKGVAFGTRGAARRMVAQGHGHIVTIASLAALAPVPGLPLYAAAKHAARAFCLSAAVELQGTGVAVTVVCPDAVATPMLDLQKDSDAAVLTFSGPRILCAQEVAATVVGPVLAGRPLEVVLPRHRGWLAHLANVFPGLAMRMHPWLARLGRAQQRRYRARQASGPV